MKKTIKELKSKKIYLPILADLPGPKYRVGEISNGSMEVEIDQEIIFDCNSEPIMAPKISAQPYLFTASILILERKTFNFHALCAP